MTEVHKELNKSQNLIAPSVSQVARNTLTLEISA